MKIKIIRAHCGQAALLSELAYRSKAHWGYSASFMAQCKQELTYSSDDITKHLFYCLEFDGQIACFYGLKAIDEQVADLDALFVEPELIGNGYGRKLIDHAKQIALANGFTKIRIQSDPNSVEFYCAVGAIQIGSEPSHSIPGRELPLFELRL